VSRLPALKGHWHPGAAPAPRASCPRALSTLAHQPARGRAGAPAREPGRPGDQFGMSRTCPTLSLEGSEMWFSFEIAVTVVLYRAAMALSVSPGFTV